MLGQETRDFGAMIVQQGYKSSFKIVYGHSRVDRPNEKFFWVYVRFGVTSRKLLSRSQQRKKIGGSSDRMISILYNFMLQKQSHWTCVIRILELVIGVRSTHMSSVSLRMIVLEGCRFEFIWVKKKSFQFWRGWCHCRHIASNAGYKTRTPLLFIVMIESTY